jgi:hypothetical protein
MYLLNTPIAKSVTPVEKTAACSVLIRCLYTLPAIVIALTLVSIARAQDAITVTPDGKVGVGTTSPGNKLSVSGDADVSGKVGIGNTSPARALDIRSSESGNGMLRLRNSATSASEASIGFYPSSGAADADAWVAGVGGSPNAGKFTIGYQGVRLLIDQSGNVDIGGNTTIGGNVGIGTTSPARALDIQSANSGFGMVRLRNTSKSTNEASIAFYGSPGAVESDAWVAGIGAWGKTGNFTIGYKTGVNFLIDQRGNVGIGTDTPGKGKLQIEGASSDNKPGFAYVKYFDATGLHDGAGGGNVNESLSIYASDAVSVGRLFVFSDERIKRIHGRSDGAKDLAALMGIEITDYEYGDPIAKGRASQKKVIGQQVEKVFPEAVRKSTDVVPDIYQKATIKDGWVTLVTNLKKGERVRLIGEDKETVTEVLEVANGKFRTAFAPAGNQVFVYGREVNDFRNVDYDAISMLNVSATQYLKKETDTEVKALQDENATLRNRLNAQEQRLNELQAKIDALVARDKETPRVNTAKKVD